MHSDFANSSNNVFLTGSGSNPGSRVAFNGLFSLLQAGTVPQFLLVFHNLDIFKEYRLVTLETVPPQELVLFFLRI